MNIVRRHVSKAREISGRIFKNWAPKALLVWVTFVVWYIALLTLGNDDTLSNRVINVIIWRLDRRNLPKCLWKFCARKHTHTHVCKQCVSVLRRTGSREDRWNRWRSFEAPSCTIDREFMWFSQRGGEDRRRKKKKKHARTAWRIDESSSTRCILWNWHYLTRHLIYLNHKTDFK